jgi:adenosine deaminase
MTIQTYVHAMPKVALDLQLERTFIRSTIEMIAEQNGLSGDAKRMKSILHTYYKERAGVTSESTYLEVASLVRYPDDLARVVYDLGLRLHKSNYVYAEVIVSPAIYNDQGLPFEAIMRGLGEGRDKVLRGWGVRIDWLLAIPRSRPRKGDDVVRWASSATGRNNHVVGIALVGDELDQPPGQFKRALASAQKQGLQISVATGDGDDASVSIEVIEELEPTRLVCVGDVLLSDDLLTLLLERDISVQVVFQAGNDLETPIGDGVSEIRRLFDEDIKLTLGLALPFPDDEPIGTDLIRVAESEVVTLEEAEEMMLNSARFSFSTNDEKEQLVGRLQTQYQTLRSEHMP